jgi:monoterpene epsilon-lactone hydrolase
MVQVTDIQAQTMSREASNYLRSNDPMHIPGDRLTQEFADALNAEIEAQTGPLLEQVRASLRLHVETETLGGTRVVVIRPHTIQPNRRRAAGVFVHGGGFALLNAHDYNAYRMAHDLGIVVYSVDYSLSPRVKFPTALNETFAAYRAVAENHRRVVVAGSSAGGNLLITTILKACRGEADPPDGAGLFSPAVDLRAIGDSYVANDGRDPLLTRDTIIKLGDAYLGGTPRTNPEASPLLADYSDGFVPTMLTTGTRDLLQSDSVRFYWKLREAGADVHLRVWEGLWHAFEGVPGLPEGEQAMHEVFGFLDEHLDVPRVSMPSAELAPLHGVVSADMVSTPTGKLAP